MITSILQTKRNRIILLSILLLALLIRIPYIFSSPSTLVTHIPDDGYYYLQLASNFAHGHPSSVDGVHFTNGYHPLWPISITPFFLLRGLDTFLPIRLILLFSFLLNIITAWFIAKILKQLNSNDWIILLVYAAYLLNPFVHRLELYNEPATLSNLLMTLMFYLAIKFSIDNSISTKQSFYFGLIGGLLLLARTDNLLFYLLALLAVLIWCRPVPWKRLFISVLVSGLVNLPWFIFNLSTFGTFVQVSAIACPYIAYANEPATLGQMLSFTDPQGFQNRIYELHYAFRYSLILHGFIVLIGMSFAAFLTSNKLLKRITLLTLCSILMGIVLLYSHSVITRYLREWHVACFAPITILLMILLLHIFREVLSKKRWIIILSVSGYFILAAIGMEQNFSTQYCHWQSETPVLAEWVKTMPRGSCAIYDGGLMAYLTDGALLPIDGNVNNEAHKAVTEHRVYDYMKDNGVQYLVGWSWIKGRYGQFWGVDFDKAFELVRVIESKDRLSPIGNITIWKLIQ